jgi:hypothetical protein
MITEFSILRDILLAITKELKADPVILIFNILDEYNELSRKQLLNTLVEFQIDEIRNFKERLYLKIIVTDRSENCIKIFFNIQTTII